MGKTDLVYGTRKEKSTTITARVRISLYTQLKEMADSLGVTMSTFMADLCESAVDPEKGQLFTKKQMEDAVLRASFNVAPNAPDEIEYLEHAVNELQQRCDEFEKYCDHVEEVHKITFELYKKEALF